MSALSSLSKAAQETANATVDFYGSLQGSETLPANFLSLVATLGSISKDIGGGVDDLVNGAANGRAGRSSKGKPKKEIDPDAPKKPTTSYFAFATEERKKIHQEREREGNTSHNNSLITLEVADRWNHLTDAEKEPWIGTYKKQLAQYAIDKMAYLEKKENAEKLNSKLAASPKNNEEASVANTVEQVEDEKPDVSVPASQSKSRKSKASSTETPTSASKRPRGKDTTAEAGDSVPSPSKKDKKDKTKKRRKPLNSGM